MKIIRYKKQGSDKEYLGTIEAGTVFSLQGELPGKPTQGEKVGTLDEVQLLAPCKPSKVIAAAINYYGATDWEKGMTEPVFFLKSPTSVCAPGDTIVSPFSDVRCWGEAELTIVIGKTTKNVTVDKAKESILGFTVANDVSCDNLGTRDHHLFRSKAMDTFCPLGPYIDTEYDPSNKVIESFHNGVLVRKGNTNDLFWDPYQLISSLSRWITLHPWDIILTGSPPMIGDIAYFAEGDRFQAKVEGFPLLENDFQQGVPLDLNRKPEVLHHEGVLHV